ncbi:hypothetical protein Athai_35810 [Actinocatenispora thailandica]|uniref:Uncharacterized protein n=1 Tax=Actinocatenispora thailandica TaxID=227318 RepID=A0A7R7HXL8_9ACTN|nr:hypothetical protein [Actinocatenispora thailandica]BCJ36078.1 hypothetical protein Athai_35810 [Actinocatenispora thailandica]
MTPLESRYRRLLALYPAAHRREYADEMVTVLLADTEPGRDRPPLATVLDLLAGALTARARGTGRWLSGAAWRRAAPLAAHLACLLLAVRALPTLAILATATGGAPHWRLALVLIVASCGVWLVPLALSLVGLRWPAAAIAGMLTALVAADTLLGVEPMLALSSWYVALLGLVATLGCAVGKSAARARPLGIRRGLAVAVLLLVAAVVRRPIQVGLFVLPSGFREDGYVVAVLVLLTVLVVIMVTRRAGLTVTARVAVLLAPAWAARLAVGPVGWTPPATSLAESVLRLAAAMLAAVMTFGVGVLALAALDRLAELVRLGRAAEADLHGRA